MDHTSVFCYALFYCINILFKQFIANIHTKQLQDIAAKHIGHHRQILGVCVYFMQ